MVAELEVKKHYCVSGYVSIYPTQKLKYLPKLSIADGIAAVRRMIPNMMIDVKCTYIHDCLFRLQ